MVSLLSHLLGEMGEKRCPSGILVHRLEAQAIAGVLISVNDILSDEGVVSSATEPRSSADVKRMNGRTV